MDLTLSIIAVACGIIGLLGAVLPVLPGTIISFTGLLCVSFTEGSEIGSMKLAVWGLVAITVIVMDYVLPGYFSKRFGGTKYGSWGATIGTLLGIFLGPLGIIVGPFAGAVMGEMIGKKLTFQEAISVGFGSLMSFVVGTLFKLIAGSLMLYNIIKDIF